jgi:hypothetical protein
MIAGEIVDCLVNYFGFNDEGELTRYFCYHILGGPGPTLEGGVASILLLSVHDETERCIGCQNPHFVEAGGPAAAVAKALQYLDVYHGEDRMRKMQTALRGQAAPASAAVQSTDIASPSRRNLQ